MKETRRGKIAERMMLSISARWFEATITGPSAGKFSLPRICARHRTMKAAATARCVVR